MEAYIIIFIFLILFFSPCLFLLFFYMKINRKNNVKKTNEEYEILEKKFDDKTNGKFEVLYEQIEKNEFEEFEKERMKLVTMRVGYIFMIIAILVLWAMFYFDSKSNSFLLLYLPLLLVPVPVIIASNIENNFKLYQKKYKSKILEKFIKLYNNRLVYKEDVPDNSIIKEAYRHFHSSGEVNFGKIDDYIKYETDEFRIDCANICAIINNDIYSAKFMDSFNGIFACVVLNKNFNKEIKITTKDTNLNYRQFNVKKVTMDASEFEDIFDVYAKNDISAYMTLTHDIMLLLQEFYNECQIPFDITLRKNKLYIRLFTGPIFEPTILYSPVDKYEILKYYNILDLIFNLYKLVSKHISEDTLS